MAQQPQHEEPIDIDEIETIPEPQTQVQLKQAFYDFFHMDKRGEITGAFIVVEMTNGSYGFRKIIGENALALHGAVNQINHTR